MDKESRNTIIAALQNYPSPLVDKQKLEETVKGAREILHRTQAARRTSFSEFYMTQIRFISWKVWVAQLFIVLGTALMLQHSLHKPNENIQLIMLVSIAAPLLVTAGIQTLTRSLSCRMLEIELSTRHLLEKLILVRMSLLGIADLIGLAVLAILLSAYMKMDISIILLYLLVPFNLTCLGCLWLLNRVRTPSCGYYCLIYCGLVALVQTILALNPSLGMFETSAIGVWLALLLLTVTGITFEVSGVRKACRSIETALRIVV
ncbi:hypothetical protein [Paenibacillus macerans]|uniref:Putative membrane protein n=1 Tax=Paenibacillus macerans TaxID=44252 RepID=A0A090ZI97_PAEMA|nr:hypothetical protein [Paenibacillus macerans]KFN10098.1 putative membrane protein [Paenibacillus macerans]MCY7560978.1 hypothetical protein [Paenibacillus macerans]MEC0153603.1 hypothetical protein [Paenibacillus macerans]SUD26980.1 Uncharacterised protein [Paenibacillus macerans]